MAVTAFVYGKFLTSLGNKEIDLDSDTLKVMLTTSSYTPDQDTHQYKSDVTNEVTGTGYTAGGQALSSVNVTYTASTNTYRLDADDPSWATSTITARRAVFYDDTPAASAAKPLIAYWDFGADVSSSGGPFTLTIDAAGIFTATVA